MLNYSSFTEVPDTEGKYKINKLINYNKNNKYDCDFNTTKNLTFDHVFNEKIRNSLVGQFLDNDADFPDREIRESKMDIFFHNIMNMTTKEWEKWKVQNNFIENSLEIITQAISENLIINRKLLELKILTLRLMVSKITTIDSSLRYFKNLKNLNLGGNEITDINGDLLPRKLEMLELMSNYISNLNNLLNNPPSGLLLLGLSKNKLSTESQLQFIGDKIFYLKVLDLEDNDFNNLIDILEALKPIKTLQSLILEGNPCSTCHGYKISIVLTLPKLFYLDNNSVLSSAYIEDDCILNNDDLKMGTFFMYIYRIINFEEPERMKKIHYIYYCEIDIPVLVSESSTERQNYSRKFKSEEFEWSRFLNFKEPLLEIPADENGLKFLRDTFKSIVTVRLIEKQMSQNKTRRKESKSQRKSSISSSLLLEKTICQFKCALKNMSWSITTQDFEWSLGMDDKTLACESISLASLKYSEQGNAEKFNNNESSISSNNCDELYVSLPTMFTIQLGFGLQRYPKIEKV
ncbi:hypothetical protein HCN44_010226 [Aphidius gifuensis]|uniref:Uncharacterized protein n=1 Tax=Aphidius gifuensis TaxID=684658 RepID=A0A834XZC4_APHGI|nr:uncharacterized protein LOC122851810 [Aphidius gifuensis]KAF7993631.1 hypothetical protein HCN44_010226 [Aphidius gifuensis]